jgi:hypothetical protein
MVHVIDIGSCSQSNSEKSSSLNYFFFNFTFVFFKISVAKTLEKVNDQTWLKMYWIKVISLSVIASFVTHVACNDGLLSTKNEYSVNSCNAEGSSDCDGGLIQSNHQVSIILSLLFKFSWAGQRTRDLLLFSYIFSHFTTAITCYYLSL